MSARKQFEEELEQLKTELVKMCRLTENMIETAIKALNDQDPELGKSVSINIDAYDDDGTYEYIIE